MTKPFHFRPPILLLLALFLADNLPAQKIATLEVRPAQVDTGMLSVAKIDLDAITFEPDSALSLVSVNGTNKLPVPFQVAHEDGRTLYWLVPSKSKTKGSLLFELHKAPSPEFSKMEANTGSGALTISANSKELLSYVHQTTFPPEGIDSAYQRSGFIHPLRTPNRQEITRIQAPDHYHHYGIWNPWTHVLFEGDTLDFWNLKSRKGTVRFGNFVSISSGPVFAGYRVLHEHVAFKKNGQKKVALNELQTVRVYSPDEDQSYYIVDFTSELNCASDSPFHILQYRYAGLGWRATEKWNNYNSSILTSEGKTRKDADGTKARWYSVQGELDKDYGGAVIMAFPSNYGFPEPLRIWPENSTGGEVFAMFAPTKDKDWILKPGHTYTLKYRFIVFNGQFNKEKADAAWTHYATPPNVIVKIP